MSLTLRSNFVHKQERIVCYVYLSRDSGINRLLKDNKMSKEVKISVIKFEMVNGKKTYKSFTFKLNPKEMAKFKTEATVKKKVAEYVAKSGVYKPSELQNLKYDMKEFLEEWKKMVPVVEAEELAKLDKSPNNPETRVTPHLISRLAAGEIFVFGSNAMGYHDGGAAKQLWRSLVLSEDRDMVCRE